MISTPDRCEREFNRLRRVAHLPPRLARGGDRPIGAPDTLRFRLECSPPEPCPYLPGTSFPQLSKNPPSSTAETSTRNDFGARTIPAELLRGRRRREALCSTSDARIASAGTR